MSSDTPEGSSMEEQIARRLAAYGDPDTKGDQGDPGVRGKRGRRGGMAMSQLVAYLMIAAIGVLGLFVFEQQNDAIRETAQIAKDLNIEQNAALCERGVENREALRKLTQDIAALGRALANTPGDPPETRQRQEALEKQFKRFEEQQLVNLPEFTCPDAVPVPAE